MQRRFRLAGVALFLAIALMPLLLLPAVQAQGQEIELFNVNTTPKHILAGNTANYEWVVYNNASSPYLIQASVWPSSIEDVTYVWQDNYVTLQPGASANIILHVITNKNMVNTNTTLVINATATKMSDPTVVFTVSTSVGLQVDSLYGSKAGQNKILGIWPNNLPAPFDTNLGAFAVSMLIWVGLGLMVVFVVDPLVHIITRNTKTELDDILLRILRMPIFILIVIYGTVNSLEILNLSRDLVVQIESIYKIILVIIGAYLAYKVYDEIVLYYAKKFASKTETELDDVLVPLLEKIGMVAIPLVAVMIIFNMMGYDLTVLLAGAGFLGLVIGLAAQQTLSNFFAGIQLLADRPFKAGDSLMMDNGDICEVRHVGMRATEFYDGNSDQIVIIPNSEIASKKIVNLVKPTRTLKITLKVGVGYHSDMDLVKKLMIDAANENPHTMKGPGYEPAWRLSEFGDSALSLKLFVWIDDVAGQWRIASEIRESFLQKFRDHNIEIPFPQTVVHLIGEKK
ncbi:MAG: mechanosensitive ion channel family protein [Methanomassiliicoccales archaeon]